MYRTTILIFLMLWVFNLQAQDSLSTHYTYLKLGPSGHQFFRSLSPRGSEKFPPSLGFNVGLEYRRNRSVFEFTSIIQRQRYRKSRGAFIDEVDRVAWFVTLSYHRIHLHDFMKKKKKNLKFITRPILRILMLDRLSGATSRYNFGGSISVTEDYAEKFEDRFRFNLGLDFDISYYFKNPNSTLKAISLNTTVYPFPEYKDRPYHVSFLGGLCLYFNFDH